MDKGKRIAVLGKDGSMTFQDLSEHRNEQNVEASIQEKSDALHEPENKDES